jgi:hypothetical protein
LFFLVGETLKAFSPGLNFAPAANFRRTPFSGDFGDVCRFAADALSTPQRLLDCIFQTGIA